MGDEKKTGVLAGQRGCVGGGFLVVGCRFLIGGGGFLAENGGVIAVGKKEEVGGGRKVWGLCVRE